MSDRGPGGSFGSEPARRHLQAVRHRGRWHACVAPLEPVGRVAAGVFGGCDRLDDCGLMGLGLLSTPDAPNRSSPKGFSKGAKYGKYEHPPAHTPGRSGGGTVRCPPVGH